MGLRLTVKFKIFLCSGKRSNVDVTSSGAFFDPRAVSKRTLDGINDPRSSIAAAATGGGAQSDIIAQLTREMKLQQQGAGGGSASGGIFSGSSDANISSSSSGLGSSSHLNQLISSSSGNPANPQLSGAPSASTSLSMSQQIISQLQQDAAKLSKLNSSTEATMTGKLPSTSITSNVGHSSSGSSGYKSGMSGGVISGSGDHSSDNSLCDLTGVGKTGIKMPLTSGAVTTLSNASNRLPLSSTSLLLSNNSSLTSLNASSVTASSVVGLHTSPYLVGHGTSAASAMGITSLSTSLLQQQQLDPTSLAVAAALASASSGTSRAINIGKKPTPDKLPLLSRSQPDLFTGIDAGSTAALAALEGM